MCGKRENVSTKMHAIYVIFCSPLPQQIYVSIKVQVCKADAFTTSMHSCNLIYLTLKKETFNWRLWIWEGGGTIISAYDETTAGAPHRLTMFTLTTPIPAVARAFNERGTCADGHAIGARPQETLQR